MHTTGEKNFIIIRYPTLEPQNVPMNPSPKIAFAYSLPFIHPNNPWCGSVSSYTLFVGSGFIIIANMQNPRQVNRFISSKWGSRRLYIKLLLRAKYKDAGTFEMSSIKYIITLLNLGVFTWSSSVRYADGSNEINTIAKKAIKAPIFSNLWALLPRINMIGMRTMPCRLVKANAWLWIMFKLPHIRADCHII